MILYAVHCNGEVTNKKPSIISIWRTLEDATKAARSYINNWKEYSEVPRYTIDAINTDLEGKCVYDYDWYR